MTHTLEQTQALLLAKAAGYPESEWGSGFILHLKPSLVPCWIVFDEPATCGGPLLACSVGYHPDARKKAIAEAEKAFKAVKSLDRSPNNPLVYLG
jgi:hypothetical protein